MAHVPMDDIQQLWNQDRDRSWSGLHDALEGRRNRAEGISDKLVDEMERQAQDMERSGQRFPQSAGQLYDIMNSQLEKMPD